MTNNYIRVSVTRALPTADRTVTRPSTTILGTFFFRADDERGRKQAIARAKALAAMPRGARDPQPRLSIWAPIPEFAVNIIRP